MNQNEKVYKDLVEDVLKNGEPRSDRTGTGTIAVFGRQMRFDLRGGKIPLLTTKYVSYKSVIHELVWFLGGKTDSNLLEEKKVTIWKKNTRREFLDGRGLTDLPEGDIGAGYGFQWRHFGADYVDCQTDYGSEGIDQISEIVRLLKEDPTSRRIFMSSWNPSALHRMALPPCHVSLQLYVDNEGNLSGHVYQRSVDCFLGLPFNIASYGILIHVLAKACSLGCGDLVLSTGDTHVYNDHVDLAKEQLGRKEFPCPTVKIGDFGGDVFSVTDKHVFVCDYQYHPAIKATMS
jgi:thymidylate synthase